MITTTILGTKISVGDTVRVHYKIIEKEVIAGKTKREKKEEQKERLQVFEGIVIAIRGGSGASFVVRRIGVGNVGIERIFPAISPWIKKIEVKRTGDVRRAKLYSLRQKSKKEIARLASTVVTQAVVDPVKPKTEVSAPTSTHANQQSA